QDRTPHIRPKKFSGRLRTAQDGSGHYRCLPVTESTINIFPKKGNHSLPRHMLDTTLNVATPTADTNLMEIANNFNDRLIIIDKTLSDNEMKNLLRCSDCFISLHRSEGFGLGLSEAMSLGKPTIATRYGGNVDFMNESNSCLVDYKLEPVGDNCYPHWQGQYWAEADVDQAFCYMLELLRDRHKRKIIGDNAKLQMRKQLSYASIGQLYENRILEVMESKRH
ncbi:glycosyltransferase, partial [Planktothrix sp.]|uniref:glycosyltransferase n=1 Tax=Planktothrix sp. TaxID=3088171 RepID=UPI0038D4FE22